MKIEKLYDNWIETETPLTYHGWPTIANVGDDQLMAVCSGGRQGHVCPYGRVYLYSSFNGGRNWSPPQIITNGPLDDRDAGIVTAPDGSILINYFTSIYFIDTYRDQKTPPEWKKVEKSITLETLKKEHGFFLKRSTDGGKNWSDKIPVPVNNVHGPTVLKDGSLFWVGSELSFTYAQSSRIGDRVIAVRSTDNGLTWETISEIRPPAGQNVRNWHELHTVQAKDGTIITQIRNHHGNDIYNGVDVDTWQTLSFDNGHTWTVPRRVCYGFPTHLLNLIDGRVLMSYGYRRSPYGNRCRISKDNGISWSEELILSEDGFSWDVGYPSTAQLSDGTLVTLWYQFRDSTGLASLRCMGWRLA